MAKARGLSIDIKRRSEGDDDEEQLDEEQLKQQKKIKRLFSALGGEGRIRVHRKYPDRRPAWCGSMEVDEGLYADLHERLCRQFGSGEYELQAFHGGEYLAMATILIEHPEYPPKLNKAEEKGTATNAAAAGPSSRERELEAQLEIARLEARKLQQDGFAAVLETVTNANKQIMELALRGQTAPAAQPGSLTELVAVSKLLQQWGWQPNAGQSNDHLSFGQQVILNPLTKLAETVGAGVSAKLGNYFVEQQKAAQQPQLAARPPQPQQSQQQQPPQPQPAPSSSGSTAKAAPTSDRAELREGLLAEGAKNFTLIPGARLVQKPPAQPEPRPAPEAGSVRPDAVKK